MNLSNNSETNVCYSTPIINATEFSTAGFFEVPGAGRVIANFNLGWRFFRGVAPESLTVDFDASAWELVNLPHGVDGALPEEASGGVNYQGPVVYRKVFTPDEIFVGKRITLHFDGILGRSQIWVNGKKLLEHVSGFLPAIVDISDAIMIDQTNVVMVIADNSDDPTYPPGKSQNQLDYSYFGGIYRNVTLVATEKIYVSFPNDVDLIGSGGVFARTKNLNEESAQVSIDVHVVNDSSDAGNYKVEVELVDSVGCVVASSADSVELSPSSSTVSYQSLTVARPRVWEPDSPVLYHLIVHIKDTEGNSLDGLRQRFGIRTVELTPEDGLVLNGKSFPEKLIGVNRHQDFAMLGFALPDATHWRDVKKLRDAGVRVVRNAHYPQSPAFMDACDELGMFVIGNTPGWQFWNDSPAFEEFVCSDIRNMIRRDRNRPSVFLWEPVLNETNYPERFARTAHEIVKAEYLGETCYTAADDHASGHEHFDVQFAHPTNDETELRVRADSRKVFFTREWGDSVDDWYAQNSPSRVARWWGEVAQLTQSAHYAQAETLPNTSWEVLHRTPASHFGGTLWHSFDHQRGYHPTPFLGGIMDSFRRPKYSYELFKAQRPAALSHDFAESGPMIFIGHEMTPFSPRDIAVYTNCDEVRLSVNGVVAETQPVPRTAPGMPSPILTFTNIFEFSAIKELTRAGRGEEVCLLAEGMISGRVVTSHIVRPAGRADSISLRLDSCGLHPVADGSSVVTVIAAITDHSGTTKRLDGGSVDFEVLGQGSLVEADSPCGSVRPVQWGEAAAIVRMSQNAGAVRIIARYASAGVHLPTSAVLDFVSVPAKGMFIGDEVAIGVRGNATEAPIADATSMQLDLEAEEKLLYRRLNREVEQQQADFEGRKATGP